MRRCWLFGEDLGRPSGFQLWAGWQFFREGEGLSVPLKSTPAAWGYAYVEFTSDDAVKVMYSRNIHWILRNMDDMSAKSIGLRPFLWPFFEGTWWSNIRILRNLGIFASKLGHGKPQISIPNRQKRWSTTGFWLFSSCSEKFDVQFPLYTWTVV